MRWAVVCLALLTYCTGRSSWTQPPSSSVSPGETVSLDCITQSTRSIYWHQQKEGEAPRFVHCDGCDNRGEGIPNRFTATRSGTTGCLAITNAEAEDDADYFCGSWNSAGNQLHSGESLWGSVTKTFLLPLESETTCNIPSSMTGDV
uniref:Ig-like domain-containing protein n=1 Tax=Pseudonaja textilis TaxID=8673 RepID=A0A670Z2Z3_PSETE